MFTANVHWLVDVQNVKVLERAVQVRLWSDVGLGRISSEMLLFTHDEDPVAFARKLARALNAAADVAEGKESFMQCAACCEHVPIREIDQDFGNGDVCKDCVADLRANQPSR